MSERIPRYIKNRDEQVAAKVRRVLREFNDDRAPVVTCVAQLAHRCRRLSKEVADLKDELRRHQEAPMLDSSDGEYHR